MLSFYNLIFLLPFQPFRNAPTLLAEAKTIYGDGHTGRKYVTNAVDMDEKVFWANFYDRLILFWYISAIQKLNIWHS